MQVKIQIKCRENYRNYTTGNTEIKKNKMSRKYRNTKISRNLQKIFDRKYRNKKMLIKYRNFAKKKSTKIENRKHLQKLYGRKYRKMSKNYRNHTTEKYRNTEKC